MKRWTSFFVFTVFLFLVFVFAGCGKKNKDEEATIVSFAGSAPVGDFIVVQIDRTNSKVRHINYTANPDEDSGWLSYTSVAASSTDAEGFSIIKRVELPSTNYVLFAEFPNTAVVYQEFTSAGTPVGWPVYVVYRESVNKSVYYEKAYNWMKFTIDETVSMDSAMEAGFAAFDATSNFGILYGAGYYSLDDTINDINNGDTSRVDSFTANTSLVANTMWTGTVGDMDTAITLTGTASGTNILDFGPGAGGGSGLAIPQSEVTLPEAAGTYFLLCYENNKTDTTSTVNRLKLVISATGDIQAFPFTERTDGAAVFTDTLTAIADLIAADSPGGAIAIKTQFETVAGNAGATSTVVQNAHNCEGSFVAISATGNQVVNIIFDPAGGFCGFTMFEAVSDNIIRFGFGIKDTGYVNQ